MGIFYVYLYTKDAQIILESLAASMIPSYNKWGFSRPKKMMVPRPNKEFPNQF